VANDYREKATYTPGQVSRAVSDALFGTWRRYIGELQAWGLDTGPKGVDVIRLPIPALGAGAGDRGGGQVRRPNKRPVFRAFDASNARSCGIPH